MITDGASDVPGQPATGQAVGTLYDLMVAVGPAADGMISGGRPRRLAPDRRADPPRLPAPSRPPHRPMTIKRQPRLGERAHRTVSLAHPWPTARCVAVKASRRGRTARSRVLREDYPFPGDARLPRTRDARGIARRGPVAG